MGSYLSYKPKIYPKAHENPKTFSCIFGSIFLESSIQCPWGEDCITMDARNNTLRGVLTTILDKVVLISMSTITTTPSTETPSWSDRPFPFPCWYWWFCPQHKSYFGVLYPSSLLSQPALRRGHEKGLSCGPRVCLPSKENAWSRHQRLLKEHVGKTKKTMVCVFWKWRFRSCLRTGKVLAPPRAHHKGRKPSINCANMTSKLCIFPFLCFCIFPFYVLFMFFYFCVLFMFFTFVWSTRVFPSLLRIPQLRWKNQTYIVL